MVTLFGDLAAYLTLSGPLVVFRVLGACNLCPGFCCLSPSTSSWLSPVPLAVACGGLAGLSMSPFACGNPLVGHYILPNAPSPEAQDGTLSQNLRPVWSWQVPHLHKTSLFWKGTIVLRRKWQQKLPKTWPLLRISPRSWETAKFCELVAWGPHPCSGGRHLGRCPAQHCAGKSPSSATMQPGRGRNHPVARSRWVRAGSNPSHHRRCPPECHPASPKPPRASRAPPQRQ